MPLEVLVEFAVLTALHPLGEHLWKSSRSGEIDPRGSVGRALNSLAVQEVATTGAVVAVVAALVAVLVPPRMRM